MIKDIKYSGITTAQSDYESPDGALSESLNLISEDQHLTPIFQPKLKVQLQAGCNVVGIHRTAQYTHYLVYNETSYDLSWMNEGSQTLNAISRVPSFKDLEFVGNTLLILSQDSINYFLWKEDKYIKLGDHLPNVEISFGLKGKPRFFSVSDDSKKTFTITFDGIAKDKLFEVWSEANKKKITEQVMAKVNRFLREQTINKGRFALPFMVRYALRMYDGSLVCHSAPILMNPSTFAAPIVYWLHAGGKDSYTDAECDIMLVSSALDYQLVADKDNEYHDLTKNWSDIIKSVDVFVSAPIYTYDQDGECSSFADTDNFETKFIGSLDYKGYSYDIKEDHVVLPISVDGHIISMDTQPETSLLKEKYAEWKYSMLYDLYKSKERKHPSMTINLPEFSLDKVRENIENVNNFYLLYSIELKELSTTIRKDIVVSKEYLQSLVTRETMTDDYLSHDRLMAQFAHGYNSRLNLSGIKRELFRGFYTSSMFAYCNCTSLSWKVSVDEKGNDMAILSSHPLGICDLSVDVYIKENGNTHIVHTTDTTFLSYILSDTMYPTQEDANTGTNGYLDKRSWGCYVYYPNRNAFKMVIQDYKGKYIYNLKAHNFLNGAFCFIDYQLQRNENTEILPTVNISNIIEVANKIYTSEVNNPFLFLPSGINSVGTGTILGISSATKALSQGQFGQFPLYAFTDEGVWALEVSPTGTYNAKQPITRDVCINAKSITQLDNAVLFATSRGIMIISGSQTACITDSIDSPAPFNALSLPGMAQLHTAAGHGVDTCFPTVPFLTFLEGCSMIYDYVHQHIVVFNKAYTYAYVYSLKSKEWGMMYSTLSSSINAYPDALAMTTDNKLVSFSGTDEEISTGLFLSRPIKLDTPDVLKTINTCIQRGMFKRGDVQTALWGSRDLYNWHLIGSSVDNYLRGIRGTPYKYFRIAGITEFKPDMSLFGVTLQFIPKFTNTPR